jgi:Transposase DDE domain
VTWIGSFRRPSVGAVSILGPDAQTRLDNNPHAIRQRRETFEHPFGTMKARMGATHFLTKTLPKAAAEMALSVLAYNLIRVMNIVGIKPLIAAIMA